MTRPVRGRRSSFVRRMAVSAAVVTGVLYVLALLLIGLTVSEVGEGADSTPMHQCRHTSQRPRDAVVSTHEVRFVPPAIMCRTTAGKRFDSGVVSSGYHLTLGVAFATTIVFTAAAFVQADRRAAASQRG
ncbi:MULTISPECIES: hypothetical protein [unclassified Streptomyces]|uniref:hypothetical protein n=1 Tax=unclassified Streptomyces TaxID=2593676 RepID=UPI002271E4E3|nr:MULTISPECIES: hypothetical protein [unclassified Streptomyces]MCY0920017.1 hypothetical protein [Streptomyces sp. H27-G5]MCY0955506.1 hypothetical protein [Streptomyces sp. H27-H5]